MADGSGRSRRVVWRRRSRVRGRIPRPRCTTRRGTTRRTARKVRTRSGSGPPGSRACRTGAPTSNWVRRATDAQPKARMADFRSVVITGASRGLGFASAVRLYREGWQVVATVRTPGECNALLRQAAGASDDDNRLICVQLDLMDSASVAAAAKVIEDTVGPPYALVHNAGISAAGMVEETDTELWQRMFATHVMGP